MTGNPSRIGRYTVAEDLGSGGMGKVYLAYSPAGDPVAVKVIRTDRLDPQTRARFEREALIARTVIGTNRVARFLDADPYADQPWLAMEYVPGRTLLHHVNETGVLAEPLTASLGALLAEGLEAVHTAGLLHRDLKPQNIMLGSDGPMIIDFGLGAFLDSSKDSLSHSGMIIGTIRCMPPEQASGHPHVTPAADVYALGTVLLYASTGHYPYDGTRWEAIAAQITNAQVEPNLSDVPTSLTPLLTSMLAPSPDDRPTLEEVASACANLLVRAGLTPANARLELIAATKSGTDPARSPTALSPSMEKRIEEQAASGNDEVSPLDAPPPEPEGEEAAPEAAGPPSRPEEEEPGSPGRPRARRGRPPASERIAEELRAQYGVQSSL